MSYAHSTTHAADHEHFDAHGHKDHGHVIVNIWTLRIILGALLFFTLATVGAAVVEGWISSTFNVIIPQWLNVFVALSIAVVKTTLVVMFFMQLKYDNPLNTMIFIFTVLTVAFFLGFTAIDLGKRQTIDRFKGQYIHEGGSIGAGGPINPYPNKQLEARSKADADNMAPNAYAYTNMKNDESIVDRAKRLAAEKHALGLDHPHAGHAAHGHDDHGQLGSITNAGYRRHLPAVGSSSDRSRPITGITLPGFADSAPPHDTHDAHGHEADAHAAPEKPAH